MKGDHDETSDAAKRLFTLLFVDLAKVVSPTLAAFLNTGGGSLTVDKYMNLFNLSDEAFLFQLVAVQGEYMSGAKTNNPANGTTEQKPRGRPKDKPSLDGHLSVFNKFCGETKTRRTEEISTTPMAMSPVGEGWYEAAVDALNDGWVGNSGPTGGGDAENIEMEENRNDSWILDE